MKSIRLRVGVASIGLVGIAAWCFMGGEPANTAMSVTGPGRVEEAVAAPSVASADPPSPRREISTTASGVAQDEPTAGEAESSTVPAEVSGDAALAGEVIDSSGAPCPSASVFARRLEPGQSLGAPVGGWRTRHRPPSGLVGKTGEDGRFEIGDAEHGAIYELFVASSGSIATTDALALMWTVAPATELRLVLSQVSLIVRVLPDEAVLAEILPNALQYHVSVTHAAKDGMTMRGESMNTERRHVFVVDGGAQVQVTVEGRGFQMATLAVSVPIGQLEHVVPVVIRLSSGGGLVELAVADEDGRALGGLKPSVGGVPAAQAYFAEDTSWMFRSDPPEFRHEMRHVGGGTYRINIVTPGKYEIEVPAVLEDYLVGMSVPFETACEGPVTLEAVMRKGGSVRVVAPEERKDYQLLLRNAAGERQRGRFRVHKTPAGEVEAGAFDFDDVLAPGAYVVFDYSNKQEWSVHVQAGQVNVVRVR